MSIPVHPHLPCKSPPAPSFSILLKKDLTNHGSLNNVTNIPSISQEDFPALANFAREHKVNFLIPGPEAPLVAGITDYFHQNVNGIRVFGPSQAAARMEGSKTFSKDFMKEYNIPTAAYENFDDFDAATAYLNSIDHPVVIKADGLAAGKGVIIPQTKEEAHAALKDIMLTREFGDAGNSVVIEEFLEGEECSILTFSDGHSIASLPPAQDHKRIGDGDTGPNTGGMGTYAPCPDRVISESQLEHINKTILQPTIDGMNKSGYTFTGCLFTGLMMTKNGAKVLEYNVRFGDPETQSVLPLLLTDLAELMYACTTKSLASLPIRISSDSAATVVLAAPGYPGSYPKNLPITLTTPPADVVVFHAGTTVKDGVLVTSGGRVIAATATGPNLAAAVKRAYEGVETIRFEGAQFRRDIAAKGLK